MSAMIDRWAPDAKNEVDALLLAWQRQGRVERLTARRNSNKRLDRQDIWERGNGLCHICGGPADPVAWDIDHITPKSQGGTDDPSNLGVSHPSCNRSKGRG